MNEDVKVFVTWTALILTAVSIATLTAFGLFRAGIAIFDQFDGTDRPPCLRGHDERIHNYLQFRCDEYDSEVK